MIAAAIRRPLSVALCSLSVLAGAGLAHADALPPLEANDGGALPSAGVQLTGVSFAGNSRISTAELQQLAAPLLGREISIGELESLRHRITQLYVSRGFVNSGALFADPPVVDGELRLRIVEGRITEIRVSGNGRLDPAFIEQRLYRPDEILDLNELQQRYQVLLADPLLERLDVRLDPGLEPGQALLVVDTRLARPWALSAFVNNHRNVSVGETVFGVAGLWRNLSGRGDIIDATLQHSRGAQRSSLGWNLPLPARGLSLWVRHDNGDARVIEAPLDSADVESEVNGAEIGLSQLLIDRLDRRFTVGLGYAERRNSTSILGEPFSFIPGEDSGVSRVRIWRFYQELMLRSRESVLALRSTFNGGRSNTAADDPGDLVVNPSEYFAYWLLQGHYVWRPTAREWHVELRAHAQKAQDPLVPLEQFALGGHASVRGYRENQFVRDNGYFGSVELNLPLRAEWARAAQVRLYLFADTGAAWNRNQDRAHLRSAGAGLRAVHGGLNFDLAWAEAFDPRAHGDSKGLQDRGLHFSLTYVF